MLLLQTRDIFSISLFALHYTRQSQTSISPSQRFTRCYLTYASASAERTGKFQQSQAYQSESGTNLKLEGHFFQTFMCTLCFSKTKHSRGCKDRKVFFLSASPSASKNINIHRKRKKIWSELVSDLSILQLMEMCEQMYF